MLNHVAELLAKRSEGFIRAEIMDQGRAIHGVCKEDNDITREVHNIKHFTAQAVATMESATRTIGKRIITILRRIILYLSYRLPIHRLCFSRRNAKHEGVGNGQASEAPSALRWRPVLASLFFGVQQHQRSNNSG